MNSLDTRGRIAQEFQICANMGGRHQPGDSIHLNARGRDRAEGSNSLYAGNSDNAGDSKSLKFWMVRMRAMMRVRTHAGGIDRAGDLILLECGREIAQEIQFTRMREREIAREIRIRSHSGGRNRAGDSNLLKCGRQRSRWRFKFDRMRELVIASDDSNSLKCGKD